MILFVITSSSLLLFLFVSPAIHQPCFEFKETLTDWSLIDYKKKKEEVTSHSLV